MPGLSEKVAAELEQIERALGELPAARRIKKLSVLELGGTGSLLSAVYHGAENILKQCLIALGATLPTGAAWHRDLLQSAGDHGIISGEMRDLLAPYMAFRHVFTHAYGFELDPERLQPLVRDVPTVYARFKKEVKRFARAQARRQSSSGSRS